MFLYKSQGVTSQIIEKSPKNIHESERKSRKNILQSHGSVFQSCRSVIRSLSRRNIKADSGLHIFARGLHKMICKTYQTQSVTKNNLKHVLMNPKDHIKRFVEERKETRMQKKLL